MNTRHARIALCLVGAALASPGYAAGLTMPREGWVSWEVAAVDGAPDICCWGWRDSGTSRMACRLDDHNSGNVGSRESATTEAVRMYARVAAGKVEQLRVYSASCPVEARTPIQVIETTTDDSARWLIALLKTSAAATGRNDVGENALAGLANHRSELAQEVLVEIARGGGHAETRKKAIFWLAHLRGVAGADVVSSLMFSDKDAELRKHAAFAISQSKSPRIARDLIRLGNTDKVGDVRAQAWFWLAHTGIPDSEAPIFAALRNDGDDHVREQAIFALSQLPDERATRALITVAEDRSLSKEQRKRAMFWLGHSEAEGAQRYLEKVLVGKVAD